MTKLIGDSNQTKVTEISQYLEGFESYGINVKIKTNDYEFTLYGCDKTVYIDEDENEIIDYVDYCYFSDDNTTLRLIESHSSYDKVIEIDVSEIIEVTEVFI